MPSQNFTSPPFRSLGEIPRTLAEILSYPERSIPFPERSRRAGLAVEGRVLVALEIIVTPIPTFPLETGGRGVAEVYDGAPSQPSRNSLPPRFSGGGLGWGADLGVAEVTDSGLLLPLDMTMVKVYVVTLATAPRPKRQAVSDQPTNAGLRRPKTDDTRQRPAHQTSDQHLKGGTMNRSANPQNQPNFFDARGSVIPFVAVLMPVLLGMVALAVDVGYNRANKAQMENTTAAAALACQSYLSSTPDDVTIADAKAKAKLYAGNNYNRVMGIGSITLADSDIQVGYWYEGSATGSGSFTPKTVAQATANPSEPINACKVSAPAAASGSTVPTFFSRIWGINQTSVLDTYAVAVYGVSTKPINLYFTQDVTQSFSSVSADPDGSGTATGGAANVADQALAKCVQDRKASGSKVGLTTYDLFVNDPSPDPTTASIKLLVDGTGTATMVDGVTGAGSVTGASSTTPGGIQNALAYMTPQTCATTVNGVLNCTNTQSGIVASISQLDKLFGSATTTAQIKAITDVDSMDYALFVSTDGDANQILTTLKPSGSGTAGSWTATVADIQTEVNAEIAAGTWPADAGSPTTTPTYTGNGSQSNIDVFYDYWANFWKGYCGVSTVTSTGTPPTFAAAQHNFIAQACAEKAAKSACDKGYKIYASYYVGSVATTNATNAKRYTCDNLTAGDDLETPFFFKPTSAADLLNKAESICKDATSLVDQH